MAAFLASLASLGGGGGFGGSQPDVLKSGVNDSPFNNVISPGPNIFAPVGGGENPNFNAVFGGSTPFSLGSDPQTLSGAVSRTAVPVVLLGVAGLLLFQLVKKGRR